MHVLSIIIIKVGTGIVHVVPDRIMALHFQLDFDASLLAPAPAQCKQLTDARVMFCSACLGARGAFPGGGRQRQGPRAGDSGGREEAGRVAPRRGAEEAVVRHVAAAVHVDRRRKGGAGCTRASAADYCVQHAACMALAVRRKSRRGGGYLITTRRQRDFWLLA
jgi:hypothetical protein